MFAKHLEMTRPGDRRSRPESPRRGFTLVEVLVVIAVIGMLVAILIPAVGSVRSMAQTSYCLNNLRDLGMSAQVYVTDRDFYPAGYDDKTAASVRRWMDALKPYMQKSGKTYRCPLDTEAAPLSWDPEMTLSYGLNVWNFHNNQKTCFWYATPKSGRYGGVYSFDVRHPSQVILFADCTSGKYYCGSGSVFNDPVPYVAYRHPGSAFNAVYCDGHAETRFETTQQDWDAAQ